MNTSRTGASQRFDFSKPPPGYSVSGQKTTKSNTPTANATPKATYYNTPNPTATRHHSAKTTQSSYRQASSGSNQNAHSSYQQVSKGSNQNPQSSYQAAKGSNQNSPSSYQASKGPNSQSSYQAAKGSNQNSSSSYQAAKGSNQNYQSSYQDSKGSSQNQMNIKTSSTPPPRTPYTNSAYQQRPQTPQSTPPIDSRIYSLPPPPPPPTEPYPGTMSPAPPPPTPQYVYGPMYASYPVAGMPPMSPMGMPPMPAPMGSGPYYPQHRENYRQWQYNAYRGGGYYNNYQNDRKRKISLEANDLDGNRKSSKKKKKPLSQNVPTRKTWSMEDAKRAWEVERDFNKRHKSQHLIIKFPDLQLNRDIVSSFHPKIDTVYFQQPSTPRFCFVTLKDSAAMEEVIRELNKIKFGDGYLTAEPKKDREEEFNIGPEDIDPMNLYVGNLAQEITVDDVVKAYPKNKRIDIGFAKKIKFTRYAFVSFRTVDDAIEAFQNTHNTEMYNKSLIVRFRRLHGTVGLPGEPKPHNPHKKIEDRNPNDSSSCDPDSTTKDDSDPYKGTLKEEQPDTYSYHSGSEDEEDDEEELRYSNSISNVVFNSLDPQVAARVKDEPEDYNEDGSIGEDLPEDKQHIPILEAKPEPDLKPPMMIKTEKQEVADDEYTAEGRRTDEDDFEIEESSNDPLYGMFGQGALLSNDKENTDE